jgi:multiple sugar transport system permease protein/N,N'-diacetylchitobiose transport system permease protein
MAEAGTSFPGSQPVKKSAWRRFWQSERWLAWALILPSLIVVFGLILGPILRAFWMSLHFVNLKRPDVGTPFIGLENYVDILSDPYFWATIGRTFYFMIVSIALELVLGIGTALLLNRKFRGRAFVRSLILIPWALPITIAAAMWLWIFNPTYGALNSLLWQMGIIDEYRLWLSTPLSAMHVVVLADVWKVTPLVILLTLAALQTIPKELYEAAMIDGAGRWSSFWKVTLPLLTPTIVVTLVIRTMDAFKVFDIIYIMTSGGPSDGTKVISYLTYQEAFTYLNFGRGSALAYLMTLFIALMAFAYIKLLHRDVEY